MFRVASERLIFTCGKFRVCENCAQEVLVEPTAAFAREFGAWLHAEQITLTALAEKLGTNRVSVRHWRTGQSFPRDEFCDKLFEISGGKLTAFGAGRDAARSVHEQSIPASVKYERREKYNANPELYRGRALKSWRKGYNAKRQYVSDA